MECPRIILQPEAIRGILTDLISEYIRIEKNESGLSYQQKSDSVRGQILLMTSFLNEEWKWKEEHQSFYAFLQYIVNKYELIGVWRINDLFQNENN
ncbi:hypothetical protein COE43_12425 [Bacillus cereus]|nr:hypothetical protein COE43_12425 [Bacillus cereus]